jgi:hypothetical protein
MRHDCGPLLRFPGCRAFRRMDPNFAGRHSLRQTQVAINCVGIRSWNTCSYARNALHLGSLHQGMGNMTAVHMAAGFWVYPPWYGRAANAGAWAWASRVATPTVIPTGWV